MKTINKKRKIIIIEDFVTTFKNGNKFVDIEIEKKQSHQNKSPIISVKNIDINKTVSSSLSVKKGFKYFIGYKDAKKN